MFKYMVNFIKLNISLYRNVSILASYNKSRSLDKTIMKLQHKIYMYRINVMNDLILRRVENTTLKSGADTLYRFSELSSGHLTSNKLILVGNTLSSNMIKVSQNSTRWSYGQCMLFTNYI